MGRSSERRRSSTARCPTTRSRPVIPHGSSAGRRRPTRPRSSTAATNLLVEAPSLGMVRAPMALLEDHVQWIVLGLVLILVLGALIVTLRARRRSRVDAATANAEQVALEHRKAMQQNADLRERVSHLEHEIQWYRGIEDKLSDTLRIAQTTATEREQRAI